MHQVGITLLSRHVCQAVFASAAPGPPQPLGQSEHMFTASATQSGMKHPHPSACCQQPSTLVCLKGDARTRPVYGMLELLTG